MSAPRFGRDVWLIYAAGFLRSATVGLVGVVLAIYLSEIGLSAVAIGVVIGSGLAGAALATVVVGIRGDAFGRRRTLVALAVLSAAGYVTLGVSSHLAVLLPVAFFGMLNGMGRDRGAASALDQAILPETTIPERRTWVLAWYNLVLDGGHATGALAGATPALLIRAWHATPMTAHRTTFLMCAVAMVMSILPYAALTRRIEVTTSAASRSKRQRLDPHTRGVVTRLAMLFGLDSIQRRLPEFRADRILVLSAIRDVRRRAGGVVFRGTGAQRRVTCDGGLDGPSDWAH